MADASHPWSFPVLVSQLPEAGLHQVLETTPAQRGLLAAAAGVTAVLQAEASLDVTPEAGGRVHVAGTVRARVEQTCVVSLDPVENDVEELIDVTFAPPDQIPEMAALVDEAERSEGDTPDPLEAIENGIIDLGRVATDALYLAVNPYPRKPDAVFEPLVEAADPEDHPFAALKALKGEPTKPAKKKPQGG